MAEIIKNSNDESIPKELLDESTKLQDELKEFSN